MFGFSFGELVVLLIVAMVVIGPKDLPKVLRKLGQWAAKLRRMASDIRIQSGIDDVLRNEGIASDIAEIRRLARGELDAVNRAARVDLNAVGASVAAAAAPSALPGRDDPYAHGPNFDQIPIDRDRETPRDGPDNYRGLPDTALVYASTLPLTPLAADALYVTGDANAPLPSPPAAKVEPPPEHPNPA
ncbi:MAG TPA: twin-arginine translocase TatA/TatE family subunit [Polyangiaceae bacterium]